MTPTCLTTRTHSHTHTQVRPGGYYVIEDLFVKISGRLNDGRHMDGQELAGDDSDAPTMGRKISSGAGVCVCVCVCVLRVWGHRNTHTRTLARAHSHTHTRTCTRR